MSFPDDADDVPDLDESNQQFESQFDDFGGSEPEGAQVDLEGGTQAL